MSIKVVLLIEILNPKILCLIINTFLRLLISVLLHQLKEEIKAEPFIQNLVLSTIWLQKFILNKHIMENLLICLLPPLSYLSWLHNIHHSLPLNQVIHSTDAWQQTELTSSGRLIARTSQMVLNSSVMNSKISFKACFNLIHLTDHQWLRSMPILGCKDQLLLNKKLSKNS